MRRKLSDLVKMSPMLGIRLRLENGRQQLVISDPRYVSGEAILLLVDPDDIFDSNGMRFENDLDFS